MIERTRSTAEFFGILDRITALENDLNTLEYVQMDDDSISLDGWWDDMRHVIVVPRYTIPVRSAAYFSKWRKAIDGIIDVAARHGLRRTPDSIEDYGNHFYIVFECDSTWPGKQEKHWYYVSADDGETWTHQFLTVGEVQKEMIDGRLVRS